MALNGTIIEIGREQFGFEYFATDHNHPIKYRQIWPIAALKTQGMSYCRINEAVGKPASLTDGRVSCYLGQGNYVCGALPELGATKSIVIEHVPVPRPKCRSELRWYQGQWQKYNARKGWIAA